VNLSGPATEGEAPSEWTVVVDPRTE